jgi:hypothetical protein
MYRTTELGGSVYALTKSNGGWGTVYQVALP